MGMAVCGAGRTGAAVGPPGYGGGGPAGRGGGSQWGAARTAVRPEPLLRRRPPCGCVVGCRRGLGGRLCLRLWRWRRSGLSLHARCRRDRQSELVGRDEVDPTWTSVRRRRGRREASWSSTLARGRRPRRRRLWGRHMGCHTKGGSSCRGNRRAARGRMETSAGAEGGRPPPPPPRQGRCPAVAGLHRPPQ